MIRAIEEPRPVFAHLGLAADGEGAGVAQGPAAEDADLLPIALAAAALDEESGMAPALPAHDHDLGVAGPVQGLLERILEVKGLLHRRVAAKEVGAYLADHTPPEEIARVAELERAARESAPWREAGTGRPTKRDRRDIDGLADEPPAPTFEEFVRAFVKRKPLR